MLLKDRISRLAPLRVLEHPYLRLDWRAPVRDCAATKEVSQRAGGQGERVSVFMVLSSQNLVSSSIIKIHSFIQVGYIKSIIYALHRRVKGSLMDDQGASLPAMTLVDAICHLMDQAKSFNNGKQPTMKWVATTAMPKLHKNEPSPAAYERDMLDIDGAPMFNLRSCDW